MPYRVEGVVLTVDPNLIHKVDTANAQNLYSMWTVFSRCAESVEQGRRLENLSWRVWTRETFCCETTATTEPELHATQSPCATPNQSKDITSESKIPDVPQLSCSVESVVDEEALELDVYSGSPRASRPTMLRQDSAESTRSRGRERHITADHFEKMVVNIIQEKEPNLAPLPELPQASPCASSASSPSLHPESDESQVVYPDMQENVDTPATQSSDPMSAAADAPTQVSSTLVQAEQVTPAPAVDAPCNRTEVIRGFCPGQLSIPVLRLRSQNSLKAYHDAIPAPHSSPAAKAVQSKKQPAKFALGGSSASGDESSPHSVDMRQPVKSVMPNITLQSKARMFSLGGSSGSGEDNSPSLKSALHKPRPDALVSAEKKQTSFNNQVTTRTLLHASEQSDCMDESAIDDDDEDSEWEDSNEDSGKSSMEEKVLFKRIPSKVQLTSQRSLISLMFAGQEQRQRTLGNPTSQSTSAIPSRLRTLHAPSPPQMTSHPSPHDSDRGFEMAQGSRRGQLKPIIEVPRSSARPITHSSQNIPQQAALSPRTTRRNMLATELTESLRRHLLWERQQKTSTANAVLKRRHTSSDVANLRQYPDDAHMDESNHNSWNQFFNQDTNGGYHAHGW